MNSEESVAVDEIIENMDENDMSSILKTYNMVNDIKKDITKKHEQIKEKLKIALKERKWKKYYDENSKISVSISAQEREKVDKDSLKLLLNDEQYNKVIKKTTYEKLSVVTPEDRERLKKYVKK